jgi:hypothetical protein
MLTKILIDVARADLMHAKSRIRACQGDVDLVYASVVTCFAESI